MSSTDWPRCQGGTPNRYSGSAKAIWHVIALATQMSTTAVRRSVARMPLSWRNQSADVCIACSQRMTCVLLLLAKCLLYHENRAKGKVKVCRRPRRISYGSPDVLAHRPRRIGLRPREARDGRQHDSARSQMQKISAGKFHFEPPFTSFDHLVGAGEELRRDCDAECPGGCDIDVGSIVAEPM